MLRNGRRATALGYLSQASRSITNVEEFYNAVQRSYDAVDLAFSTASSGANYDVARGELANSGGAIDFRNRADAFLSKAIAENEITRDQAQIMVVDVLGPLSTSITDAKIAIDRGGNYITRYWDAFKTSAAASVASTVGFWGSEWKKAVQAYRYVQELIKLNEEGVSSIKSITTDSEMLNNLMLIDMSINDLRATLRTFEAKVVAAGGPPGYIEKEAAGLGAWQLLGTFAATHLTVASVIGLIVAGIVFTIAGTFTAEGTLLPRWLWCQRWLLDDEIRLRKLKQERETEDARMENELALANVLKAQAEASERIRKTQEITGGLADLFPQARLSNKTLLDIIEREREKHNLPSRLVGGGPDFGTYALAAASGLAVAGLIYYMRKNQ